MADVEIFKTIERMGALIRSEERKKCSKLGLQPVQLQAMDYIARCNRYSDSPAALTSYLGITKGTVSQTLLLLERKGYVIKNRDDDDKRKIHLHLSEKGKDMLQQARPLELFHQASEFLDKNEQQIENEIFTQALTALQRANNSESFGLCRSCAHFTTTSDGFMCGLTKEALSRNDSEKICREHKVAS